MAINGCAVSGNLGFMQDVDNAQAIETASRSRFSNMRSVTPLAWIASTYMNFKLRRGPSLRSYPSGWNPNTEV